TKQRIDLRACLQLRRIRGNNKHTQSSIAGNQRNGDSGLGRNPIRIMSFLLQILHECRLFLRPRDAYRTALNWRDYAFHYLARPCACDTVESQAIGSDDADCLSVRWNDFLENAEDAVTRVCHRDF